MRQVRCVTLFPFPSSVSLLPIAAFPARRFRLPRSSLTLLADVIIVEDDPYYFLQEGSYVHKSSRTTSSASDKHSDSETFINSLAPSYVSIDYQGRVIRLDTFSKTIAPGSRMGFFTCNPLFAERLERQGETSVQRPCGFGQVCFLHPFPCPPNPTLLFHLPAFPPFPFQSSPTNVYSLALHLSCSRSTCLANPRRSAQALIGQLLTKQWGLDSYIRWLHGLQAQYTARRDTLVDSLLDGFEFSLAYADGAGYLNGLPVYSCFPKGGLLKGARGGMEKQRAMGRVLSFAAPTSGMFVWVRLASSSCCDAESLWFVGDDPLRRPPARPDSRRPRSTTRP